MSCYCKCPVVLPHGVVFPDNTHLLFYVRQECHTYLFVENFTTNDSEMYTIAYVYSVQCDQSLYMYDTLVTCQGEAEARKPKGFNITWASTRETLTLLLTNNKGADPRSLMMINVSKN